MAVSKDSCLAVVQVDAVRRLSSTGLLPSRCGPSENTLTELNRDAFLIELVGRGSELCLLLSLAASRRSDDAAGVRFRDTTFAW